MFMVTTCGLTFNECMSFVGSAANSDRSRLESVILAAELFNQKKKEPKKRLLDHLIMCLQNVSGYKLSVLKALYGGNGTSRIY